MKELYGKGAECEFALPTQTPMVSLDPDITSLVDAIGWRPQTTFAEGITKIISQMESQK